MNAQKQKFWTAITYAQDFSNDGAGLGPQTILRLQRIVDARNEGYNIKAVVLAGGIGPDKSLYPKQTKPFANMMGEWLVSEGRFSANEVFCSADAWNCIDVTLEMIRLIKANRLPQNVLVVSTGRHIYPRMWTTWQLLCGGKRDWTLGFVSERKGTYDLLHEWAGTVKYIPLALWYRGKV